MRDDNSWLARIHETPKMSSIPGLPARGSNVTILITRVHLHPQCTLVEFWGTFNQERTAEYECMAREIQSPGYTFQEFEGSPCDQCLVQISGTWYRSRIVSRNDSKYSVYLCDKGITFSTTASKLAWGKKENFHLPPEVEFCVLANMLPLSPQNRWSPVALEFLKSLCGKSVNAHVQDVLVSHRMFILHIPCIAKQMYEMGFAKKLSPERFQNFVLLLLQSRCGSPVSPETQLISMGAVEQLHKREVFMYPELPAGTVETVIITEVTNPQQIFCQLKVFSQELKKLSDQLTQFCGERMTNCIVGPEMIGFPCAARGSDGRWYRSVLQQVFPSNKLVEVLNVDYGTKQFVQEKNVKPLGVKFFRLPVVTYACSLHGITDKGVGWTTSQIEYLRNLLLSKTMIAKFEYQSISEGVHYVTLFGDESTNINSLFGSKERCLLECENTLEDYAIRIPTYNRQHPAQQERNQRKMLTPGEAGKEKEGKGVAETLAAPELSLNSSHVATVQHILTPSEFWIQTQNYVNELNELMDGIYHLYKDSVNEDVERNPTVGLYCAAKAEDGDFYRAVVSQVGEAQIKVFFVDYGNTEVVDRVNIRTLPDKFKKLPWLALKCTLAGVRPKDGRWSQSASKYFSKAVTDKVLDVHVTTKHEDRYVVQLTDPKAQGERDLSALLCNSNLAERAETRKQSKAKMIDVPAILPPTQHPDARLSGMYSNSAMSSQAQNTAGPANSERINPTFKEHMFPIGSVLDVNVSYIESPSDFWCQLVQNAGHFKLLMHDIQAHYAGSEFQPFAETACVARHPDNGMWYRALVIHKHETPHVEVLFVDYGQTETVSLYDLRRIPPEFLSLQGQAFRCCLFNPVDPTSAVNEWNDEATARFHSFVKTAASNLVILKCTIYAVMYSEQKIVFNIVDLETPFESVCTSMNNLIRSAPSTKTSGPSFRLDTYYYSTHNIKTGTEEQVTVTYVNDVSQFYCQLERNTNVMNDLKIKVNNLCHQLKNVRLPAVFGTLCFAKYTDGQWYRGQIKATKPAILVNFVDYGDTIKVDKSDLLPVPREASNIMSVPVQAVLCSLSDVPANVPSEVNSWFETSTTDGKFRALVVAKETDGKLLVELYHGNTQLNSKIKKKFQIEMHTEEPVVYHGQKAYEVSPKHSQKTQKVTPKQATEMVDYTQTVKKRCSAPKPADQMRDEPKLAYKNPHSSQEISCQKVKAAHLELYRPPHQRRSCVITPISIGDGVELAGAHGERRKENTPTDTIQLSISKSPGTDSHKCSSVEELPKLADLPPNSVTLGMEADVYVSHCNSPLSFYVQLVREEDALFTIAEKLNDPKSTLKANDIKDLNPGDLVQAEFADDSSWYRAVVREIHANTMAVVEFIDFGNTAMTPMPKIGRLHKTFLELPMYSIHCMLSSAVELGEDEVSDPEVISAFKEDIGGSGEKVLRCRFIRQSGSLWEVSLEESGVNVICKVPNRRSTSGSKISDTVEEVEEKPAQNTHTRHVSENSEEMLLNPCTLHYHQQEFLEGQRLEVYIATINDDQTIWCQCADSEELDKVTLTISEVVAVADRKCINPESLSTGSPCIALFSDDKLWYRAEVIKKDGDDLWVLFVDYGNVSQVHIADVREIPPDLVETPPQAFLCKLERFDSLCGAWDNGALDELSALTADKLLVLTVTRVDRNEEKITLFVQMEFDGQVINKVMETWWKSSKTETKPEEMGLTTSKQPPLKCDSAVKETALPEDQPEYPKSQDTANAIAYSHPQREHSEEQFTNELVESHTIDDVKLASSPKTRETPEDSVNSDFFAESLKEEGDQKSLECNIAAGVPTEVIYQTESKDILQCDSGIKEYMSCSLDDNGDQGILTLSCNKTVGETDKDSEEKVASLMDTMGPNDLISPLDEHLKEATDMSEISTTNLEFSAEEVNTHNLGSSFDITIYSGDSAISTARDSPLTSVTAVKMVPHETVCLRKDSDLPEASGMISTDLKQTETDLVLPSLVLPVQQMCDAPTEHEIEAGVDLPQEVLSCVTTHVKINSISEETVDHHDSADINAAATEPGACTVPSPNMDDEVEEVPYTPEEACFTDLYTDPNEPSDDSKVTSAGDECLSSMTAQEMVLCITVQNESVDEFSEHEMEFRQLSLQEDAVSNKSCEDEMSVLPEDKLLALRSDTAHRTYTDNCLDMSSCVEQVTCIVGEICLNDVYRETQEAAVTEDREQLVHTPPQQKEDFDSEALSQEISSPEGSFVSQLSEITHLSLMISDGSTDVLPVELQPED